MSINRTERKLDNQPVRAIKDVQRQMIELKSANQPISGASIVYSSNALTTFKATIPANAVYSDLLQISATADLFPMMMYTLFVHDGTDTSDLWFEDEVWPSGGALTLNQKRDIDVHTHPDLEFGWGESNGLYRYSYQLRIINKTAASINIQFRYKFYYPSVDTV